VKAWTSPGDWSIRDSGDQVSPPSVDSVKTMVLCSFELVFPLPKLCPLPAYRLS